MEKVKQHFAAAAQAFDAVIRRLIPYYELMLEALLLALPFSPAQSLRVIAGGCGTGTVARRLKEVYPQAQSTCVDIAAKMLQLAQVKLGEPSEGLCDQLANFEAYEFDATDDMAIASLALHHGVCDDDKIKFYRKIYTGLAASGVFYNADVVLGARAPLQARYMEQWREYMRLQVPVAEIEQKWLPQHYDEDHPASLMSQGAWLQAIDFTEVDVIWKYCNFSVYGGRKPAAASQRYGSGLVGAVGVAMAVINNRCTATLTPSMAAKA